MVGSFAQLGRFRSSWGWFRVWLFAFGFRVLVSVVLRCVSVAFRVFAASVCTYGEKRCHMQYDMTDSFLRTLYSAYARVRVRAYARMRVRACARTRARANARTRERAYARTRVRAYARTRVRAHARTRVRAHARTRVRAHARTRVRAYSDCNANGRLPI